MMKQVACIGVLGLSMGVLAAETDIRYLSGKGKDDAVPWAFFCTTGMHSQVWTTIPVPSCWEQQGFGAYGYQVDPLCEQGQYRTHFWVPDAWRGQVVRLVFEGAMTDTEAWINGVSAGPKHQGGFYRFKYDVSSLVRFGETNRLEVTVAKHSSNAGVNRAERTGDYWNFGGLFRPVYLEALPAVFIDRVAVDARADGSFAADVFVGGKREQDARVSAVIEGVDCGPLEAAIAPGEGKVVLKGRVRGQKNWTAETPELYWVRLTLAVPGQASHEVRQRFGFRTVEVREGQGLFVNGQRVMLKGACRHSFWPESGRTLSEGISRSDVALMKEMNMNAVRMSHYPPDAHFLDVCDEQGLYVLDELSGWQKAHETEVGEKLVEEMVTRDVNHPCIVLWDNGNEGGWNTALDDDFSKWDTQGRHVMHPWTLSQGINTAHYRPYEEVKAACAGTTIYMPTEFMHALYDGGGGAGLDDYWEMMRRSPVSAGGFIWALVDEGVARTDQNGRIDVNGNRAPDGLVGPHREREGSFYTVREIWSPVQVRGDALPSLMVENRYDFTDLSRCRFDWALVRFPVPQEHATGSLAVAQGSLPGPRVAPHASGTLMLPLPATWRESDALQVTACDPFGRAVWTWSWLLQPRARYAAAGTQPLGQAAVKPQIAEGTGTVRVTAGDVAATFSTADGLLASVSVGGKPFALANGPRFVASATRAIPSPGKKQKPSLEMIDLSGTNRLVGLTHRVEADTAVIEARYVGGPLEEVRWTFSADGQARLDYRYRLDQPCDLAGMTFDYPETRMQAMRWLGKGPYHVWKNRLKGTQWSVWRTAYNNGVPGESWDYPEFKGYFGDWTWAVFETADGEMTWRTEDEDTYLGVYRPNEGPVPAHTKLYTPETGLALLDAIPPMGTKFHDAEAYGPQSQPNAPLGLRSRTVLLRFGK